MAAATAAAPACAEDPDCWFDPAERAHCLEWCLGCPVRSRCAAQALSAEPVYGMWAGVWIDGDFHQARTLLESIAAGSSPLRRDRLASAGAPRRCTPPPPSGADEVVLQRRRDTHATVLARSNGHCEIMTAVCRFTAETTGSRVAGRELLYASESYAVCRPCRQVVAGMEGRLARALGYVVDDAYEPSFTRFYWRQRQWAYLDGSVVIRIADEPTGTRWAV